MKRLLMSEFQIQTETPAMNCRSQKLARRDFIRHTLAAAGYCSFFAIPKLAMALSKSTLGDSELMILSDGSLSLPIDFVLPASIDKDEVTQFLLANNMDQKVLSPDCNVTLWKKDDRVILFDVGAGKNFMPTAGKLGDSLMETGIEPADITDVVFTHAHPDHLWGLLDDFDDLMFPNADYHMNELEWSYWRAADTLDKTPDVRKSFVAGAQNRLPFIEDRIKLFNVGAEVLPGMEAVDTSGHTPGHTSFALHDGGASVVLIGDAITNVQISFKQPGWPSGSDQDQDQGRKTRLNLLGRLAYDKSRVIGFHLPHPGVGRVETQGDHYIFVAEE